MTTCSISNDNQNCPDMLYRYFPLGDNETGTKWLDRILHAIRESSLYCSNRKGLNDPFDGAVRIESKSGRATIEKKIQDSVDKKMRVLCLSESKDHILMWSHYANSHHGLCLGFSMKEWNKCKPGICGYDGADGYTLRPVQYRDERPLLSEKEIGTSGREPVSTNILTKIAFTKHSDWKYEKEWRLVCSTRNDVEYYIQFPKVVLSEVIFGMKASKENQISVQNSIGACKMNNVLFYQAKENKNRFCVDVILIR
ncbi:MAG: DUF2971 domain-containing protein [Acidithiobacillus sp.]